VYLCETPCNYGESSVVKKQLAIVLITWQTSEADQISLPGKRLTLH